MGRVVMAARTYKQTTTRLLNCAFNVALCADAFHDCIQPTKRFGHRLPPGVSFQAAPDNSVCQGGLCVGMHNGPHEGGPSSYPVGTKSTGYTTVSSTMTVPDYPKTTQGICYYIWTDIFFGDMSQGVMNQFVPQLILGNALDGSSGPPLYKPKWGQHDTWKFGAHYFFEVLNATSGKRDSHAAYGDLFNTTPGELLFTSFMANSDGPHGLSWTLKMGVVGDSSRLSKVQVDQPYMGLGVHWDLPTTSWTELNYTNMCVNSCWELYGANDRDHLPGSGSHYNIKIERPITAVSSFKWTTKWDEDEGVQKPCPNCTISEYHNDTEQHILWDIFVPPPNVENSLSKLAV